MKQYITDIQCFKKSTTMHAALKIGKNQYKRSILGYNFF